MCKVVIKANEDYFMSVQSKIVKKKHRLEEIGFILQKTLPMLKKIYGFLMNFHPYFSESIDISFIDRLNQEYCTNLLGHIEELVCFLMMAI